MVFKLNHLYQGVFIYKIAVAKPNAVLVIIVTSKI